MEARSGFKQLFRAADPNKLDPQIRKSLSAFAFGNLGWIAPPEVSSRVLSCFTDASDLASLVGQTQIGAGSLVLPVDNARPQLGVFACDSACWGAGPQPDLTNGLGTMEIRVDPIRATSCATTDILADAQFPIDQWLMRKASLSFSNLINQAILYGDGLSKPAGLMHPGGGIPICEPSPATPLGTITWQDVLSLKFQVPESWLSRGSYLMSPSTLALLLTMSDATGRPLMIATPIADANMRAGLSGYSMFGSPIHVLNQFPGDISMPGTIIMGFGDWEQCYLLVWRKSVSMLTDPYSAGFCVTFRWEARVGGAVVLPCAARWLRTK